MKKSKKSVDLLAVVTTLVCLLPMIFSAMVYSELPEQMAIHWGAGGNANGWASREIAAFGMPIFLAVLNLLCHAFSNRFGEESRQPTVMLRFCKWLPALISLIFVPIMLLIALGKEIPVGVVAPCFLGALLVFVGNYLPKCRQNHTMGIKLPWTLEDEENWDKTHRMAGPVWMACGVVLLVSGFLLQQSAWVVWALTAVITVAVLIPVFYSYALSRRKKKKL